MPECLIVEIHFLLPQNVRKKHSFTILKSHKAVRIRNIEFLEPHIIYVGVLDLVTNKNLEPHILCISLLHLVFKLAKSLLKKVAISSMALSKSVNYFVNTVCYDSIAIGAFNANDGEAIQSTLPYRAAKICLVVSEVSEVSALKMARKFGANCSKCQRSRDQQPCNSNVLRINRKDLFQNKDFNIF